jgi:hypothetical protein
MQPMKLFMDTHDRAKGTFPAELDRDQLAAFFAEYEAAASTEGVSILRLHVSLEAGRAWCLTRAPDADAVRRAHAKVGLPFDDVTEVATVSPGDLFIGTRA